VYYEENRQTDIALTLQYLAEAETGAGHVERAARLFGAAEACRERIHLVMWPIDRAPYEHAVESVRAALDPAAFDAAWNEGRAMSMAQAVEYALTPE
jgi:hypothetical protein